MADKIIICTDELKAQAQKLNNLVQKIDGFVSLVQSGTKQMDDALDSKQSVNMAAKGKSLVNMVTKFRDNIKIAADVAQRCAETYENADTVLRDTIGDTLSDNTMNAPVSEQQVKTEIEMKIEDLKQKEGFREGDYWGDSGTYVNKHNGYFIGGSQCFAMAHMMQVEIMGGRGYSIGSTNFDDIQPGDVVNYYAPGLSQRWGHWVFVIGKKGDKLIVAEGNWNDKVHYYREISKNEITEVRQIDRVA